MPTEVEVVLTDSDVKVYLHEPNRVVNAVDINTISGASLPGSPLQMMLLLTRGLMGNFTNSNSYMGFRALEYDNTSITTERGVIITPDAIYQVEPLTLEPTDESHYGIYEIELVQENSDPQGKQFFDSVAETFNNAPSNTRKRFYARVFEKYNTTPDFPATTPGRIRWIEYRKQAAFQPIIGISNYLSKEAIKTQGFPTGFIRQSFTPGDGVDWYTCDGQAIDSQYVDLIDHFRSIVATPEIDVDVVTDNGSGLCRLNFPVTVNLKNIKAFPDEKYACVEITDSSAPGVYKPGFYKVVGVDPAGGYIDVNLAFPSSSMTGKITVNPFAIADNEGGGARTPFPTFLRNFNPEGDPNDTLRLPNTYQDGQIGEHQHDTSTAAHKHNFATVEHGVSNGGSIIRVVSVPAAPILYDRQTELGGGGSGPTDLTGGDDPDNLAVTRPENMAVFLLVKT